MKSIKRIVVIVLLFVGFSVNAQFKLGAGIGINSASFTGRDAVGAVSVTGLNTGIISEYKLPKLVGVELDVLLSMKGTSFTYSPEIIILTYVDVPLVVKLYINKIINIHTGFQYSRMLEANIMDENSDFFYVKEGTFKNNDYSLVFGTGLDLNRFHVSLRYIHGLPEITLDNRIIKNDMVTATLGFWIKKK